MIGVFAYYVRRLCVLHEKQRKKRVDPTRSTPCSYSVRNLFVSGLVGDKSCTVGTAGDDISCGGGGATGGGIGFGNMGRTVGASVDDGEGVMGLSCRLLLSIHGDFLDDRGCAIGASGHGLGFCNSVCAKAEGDEGCGGDGVAGDLSNVHNVLLQLQCL